MQGEDLALTGDLTAQGIAARSNIGLRFVQLINVLADPTIVPGQAAPIGSLSLLAGGAGIWQKTGPADTDWMPLTGGGGVVGPGTVNTVAKFTAANTVGDSQITDNGADVNVSAANQANLIANANASVISVAGDVELFSAVGQVQMTGPISTNIRSTQVNIGPGAGPPVPTTMETGGSSSVFNINSATDLEVNASDQLRLIGAGATGVRINASAQQLRVTTATGAVIGEAGELVSVLGAAPVGVQNITGSRADLGVGGALNQLINAMALFGFVTNNSVP